MQILHLDLKLVDENYVELRYFVDNPNQYERRSLPLTEIADLIKLAERDYYVSAFPEDYTVTGRRLYNWLDGSDRWLQPLLDKYRREGIVLAIQTRLIASLQNASLAHLPWEVLHDGNGFLVQRVPAIVPVRWVSDSTVKKLTIAGEPENRALQVLFMATSPLNAFGAESQVDEALKSQAQKLADGNPRLLEWLDKILQNKTVDVATILNRLAADPVELREQVLAEALLEQMDSTMREMLSRGLVFELPVPREALAAVCENIPNLEHYISRAVALGLLEVSHDEALRVPRILPVQIQSDGEALHKKAAEVLYRLWWEEAETSSEEQKLEIHRLALRGKEDKIAVEVATNLTNRWFSVSRFREAVVVCRSTLEIIENYRILYELAKSEQEIGLVEQAIEHYQKVLALCSPEDEIQKAATLHQLGLLKANRGEIEEAIALYEQSLALNEQIGDVQLKARTLNNLGLLKANRGEIEEAIALYQQVLAIDEQIGDVQGKAATLHEMGRLKANTGEIEEAIALFQQSLALKEQIGNVQGKAITLWWLGHIAEQQGNYNQALDYLQPALEILQRIQSPHTEGVRQMVARVQDLIRNL